MSSVLRLLDYIDNLTPQSIGTVLVGQRGCDGVVLVENRRVCWAATPGRGRRLSDLLLARAEGRLTRPALEVVVRECRTTGVPIGQALVDRGFIEDNALERALLAHTTESLVALSRLDFELSWAPRTNGFAPRHRFTTASLVSSVGRQIADCQAPDLSWLSPLGAAGAAFALDTDSRCAAPLAQVGLDELSAAELVGLCGWARSTMDLTASIDATRKMVVLGDRDTRAVVAWARVSAEQPILHVALCPHGPMMSRILSRLMTKGS